MFSKGKQVLYSVVDGLRTQKKLWLLLIVWSSCGIWWGTDRYIDTYRYFYELDISVADILILLQEKFIFGIVILPFAMFPVMKCKQRSMNTQSILRYGGREKFFRRQLGESIVYAAIITMVMIGIEVVIAMLYHLPLINWDSKSSLFFVKARCLVSENLWTVMIAVSLMYFVKLLLDMIVLDILLWNSKYLLFVWVLIMVQASVYEDDGFELFHGLFLIQYPFWPTPWRHGVVLLIGAVAAAMLYFAGRFFIRKKDIFK